MIKIEGRSLKIPTQERIIGWVGDNRVEVRIFELNRFYGDIDLSEFDFKLDTEINGTKNIIDLDKSVNDDMITLTWTIRESHILNPGHMTIQIRAFSAGEEKWHSAQGYVKVQPSINATEAQPDPLPSEFVQMEQRVTDAKNAAIGAAQDAEAHADRAQDIVDTFSDVTLPAAISAVENAGQAKVDLAEAQAIIATTKAQEASDSAAAAFASEQAAKTSEDNAAGHAGTATEQADRAQDIADTFENETLPAAITAVEAAGQAKVDLAEQQANIAAGHAQTVAAKAEETSGYMNDAFEYKEAAEGAASIATEKAWEAANSAQIAEQQAGIAATKAIEAYDSAERAKMSEEAVEGVADEHRLKIAKIERELNDYKTIMSMVNINLEPKQQVSGYGIVSLPKNAANGQISVVVKGNTITNLLGDLGAAIKKIGRSGNTEAKYPLNNLKPLTEYTLIFNVSDVVVGNGGEIQVSLTSGAATATTFPNTVGIKKYKFTTPSNFDNTKQLWVYFITVDYDRGARANISNVMIVEGDWTTRSINSIEYISGTKSTIGAVRIKSVGKNLWNEKSDTILVQPNTDYTFSCYDMPNIGAFIEEFNGAGINIYCKTVDSGGYITTTNDTRKIRYKAIQSMYTDVDIVGVEVDFVNSEFTRLAGAVNKISGADFDSINAFGGRKRCILTDDGVVLAYYGEPGYSETGATTVEITKNSVTYPVGTKVQVMVEQPKFYYKVVPLQLEKIQDGKGYHMRKVRYYVSDIYKPGFKVHPAFVRNGVEVDKIYLSAYEGSIYDESAGSYLLADEQIADFNADKLSSIANAKPASGITQNLTRANTRKLANNRGNGWQISDVLSASVTQMLFIIEYASFNTQANIGLGVVNKANGEGNESEITGATTNLGNASGMADGTNGLVSVTYRGEENFWGNIWIWVDGLNIYNQSDLYVADHDFVDDSSAEPYKDAGITLAKTNGYISAFGYNEEFDWLFFPSETLGNSALPVGDNFYQATTLNAWKVARLGGRWASSLAAGAFCWDVYDYSSHRRREAGGRLVYVPQ